MGSFQVDVASNNDPTICDATSCRQDLEPRCFQK